MDIATATFDELRQARDDINVRLKELERQAIQELEQRAHQFGFTISRNGPPPQRPKPKYSDGNGNTWGGKGRKPAWLQDAVENGATLEDFAL